MFDMLMKIVDKLVKDDIVRLRLMCAILNGKVDFCKINKMRSKL